MSGVKNTTKSGSVQLTPLTVIVLIAFVIFFAANAIFAELDAAKMHAAILANEPYIVWSHPGSKFATFLIPVLSGPPILALYYFGRRPNASRPVVITVFLLLILSFFMPVMAARMIDDQFSKLANAHGYEVCVVNQTRYGSIEILSHPNLIQSGACDVGIVQNRL